MSKTVPVPCDSAHEFMAEKCKPGDPVAQAWATWFASRGVPHTITTEMIYTHRYRGRDDSGGGSHGGWCCGYDPDAAPEGGDLT